MAQTLEEAIAPLLLAAKLTVGTAESCTGGLIGDRLTNVSGSSAYFYGGIISYDNSIKQNVLGVPADTLATVGAVSRETALAMAQGARRLLGVDIALSATGIAGPGGGSLEKPVGLVYIGLVAPDFARIERYVWAHDRIGNKQASAEAALQMLMDYLTR